MNFLKNHFLHLVVVGPAIVFGVLISATLVNAATIETGLSLNKSLTVGENVVVTIYINANDPINAIGGSLVFPADSLSVKSISDGNSVINLWIEKPKVVSSGRISFSGITPGGFTSKGGRVFSVIFNVLNNVGVESLDLQNVGAFLNDGSGVEAENIFLGADINTGDYSASGTFIRGGMREIDNEPPESFAVEITKNPVVFDNRWFLVFATQDKNSGINHYEIKEFRPKLFSFLARYRSVESPYVLSDQQRKSFVYVKAIDNAGNERETVVYPLNSLSWYEKARYQVIIIVLLIASFFIIRKLWKR